MIKQRTLKGLVLCGVLALIATFLGQLMPMVGGPVWAIALGMTLRPLMTKKNGFQEGVHYSSKILLKYAVILLGFGLNIQVVIKVGMQSLPIILVTIAMALLAAYLVGKALKMDSATATLIGVGSSICGGSAIAAAAPVIKADDEAVARSISVIFFFNVIGAVAFPLLGTALGFPSHSGETFGLFAGTAINDTSSVTAAAVTWDSMHQLGTSTLNQAVTVKLTRTLAIIPITLGLGLIQRRKEKSEAKNCSASSGFPFFILFFLLATVITTIATHYGVNPQMFHPITVLSKFLIVMAMAGIGLQTHVVHLVKKAGKPLFLGFCCSITVFLTALMMIFR